MMTFLVIIHVTACVVLIGLVLIQRGRGAGLVESFAGVESMFGTKTSAFLTRTTTIMSVVFFITCLALAVMSVRQSKSIMSNVRPKPKAAAVATEAGKAEAVKTGAPKVASVKVVDPSGKTENVKAEVVETKVAEPAAPVAVAAVAAPVAAAPVVATTAAPAPVVTVSPNEAKVK